MQLQSFVLGTQLVLANTFYDAATGEPVDPQTVTLQAMDPAGIITLVQTTNPSRGVYTALFTPTVSGIWNVRWQGAGGVVAASESKFEILPSPFA